MRARPSISAAAAVCILVLGCCCCRCTFCLASTPPVAASLQEGQLRRPVAMAHDGPPFEYGQGPIGLNLPSNNTCYNEDRIRCNRSDIWLGRFVCPEEGDSSELTECCGSDDREYCCSPWDSVGMKWGIGIGITLAVIVLMALGYTVQLFRACDRCYHEFPILGQPESSVVISVNYQFSMDTRWYSVSHEGNRYGVTFHSKSFASHFMQLLESCYGPWNAANILRIRKDDQDFVVLHIFFNDFFTPWFYTQGPIKNDEEWIRSDFKDLCYQTQFDLAINFCSCCHRGKGGPTEAESLQEDAFELMIVPAQESLAGPQQPPQQLSPKHLLTAPLPPQPLSTPQWRLPPGIRRGTAVGGRPSITSEKKDHRPWTKHTFKIGLGQRGSPKSTGSEASGGGGGGGSGRSAERDPALNPPWHRNLPSSIEEVGVDSGSNEKATQTNRGPAIVV